MTADQTILFGLFGAVFALLLWGRFRYDLVAFAALMAGVAMGVVPADEAFSGFGHPATLTVALALVLSIGLGRSGAVQLVARAIASSARPLGRHVAVMGGIGGLLSAFMNNVAALALLMPVDIRTAGKAGRPPGLSLMPLSFATILGGMVTLIGTPPNVIVASIREEALGEPFSMFDYAPAGGVAALAGLAFVALLGWRLIPARAESGGGETLDELARYVAELAVPEDSGLAGRRLDELSEEADSAGVALLGLVRDGRRLPGSRRTAKIAAGDALAVRAGPEALDEFRSAMSLDFAEGARAGRQEAEGDGTVMVEAVAPEGARIVGRSARSIGLGWRKRSTLLGISRQGRRLTKEVGRTEIRPGDLLLLLTPEDEAEDVVDWLGCLELADRGLAMTRDGKAWLAIGIFAAAVAAASIGLLALPAALGCAAVAYVLARIVPLPELYARIEWPVIVLLGSMIPLGASLEASGGTELIAGSLVGLTEGLPTWAILTALMVATMTLSDILNNAATTIVAAPVGIQMAGQLDASPDPFLMAVAIAASCAFLTPIGHKNNTLVLGPGGYRFGDYWRPGLPLEIIVVAVSIPAILAFWPP